MKTWVLILCLLVGNVQAVLAQDVKEPVTIKVSFFGHDMDIISDSTVFIPHNGELSNASIQAFYNKLNEGNYQPIITALLNLKQQQQLDDWFFYQLIRKTAQQLCPKAENYQYYTLYKWFLLGKSGYDVQLSISDGRIIFFVRSDENVYDIPFHMENGKQYVCLNIHDYMNAALEMDKVYPSSVVMPEGKKSFSYKITDIPTVAAGSYAEKDIAFNYNDEMYRFKLKVNPQLQTVFANYPVVDYESYFNIPLSKETYNSLIPVLKQDLKKMDQVDGVNYLMNFTRNAFPYEDDQKYFGKEKRMSPEQTIFSEYSDCDDRAALFFYLVKEIYDLPMIVLLYPTHVNIAVKFDKPVGKSIEYKGNKYSICEPTPQLRDLKIGQVSRKLRNTPFEVAYEYTPHYNNR